MLSSLLVTAVLLSAAPAKATPPSDTDGLRSEILFWINDAETKLTELAEATPEAKYAWRPAKDARSTGEVFMHVAGANFGIPSFFGIKPPEGFNHETYEKSLTKKADIQKALKDSFAHVKSAMEQIPATDLTKPVELFGMKSTIRGTYLLLLSHAHEHLGQSIAYARSNNIAPPWTAKQQAAFKEMKAKEAAQKAVDTAKK